MTVQILHGDCRSVLSTLPAESVQMCVTSPPYWGLRSYLPEGHPDKPREIGSEPTLQAWVDTMVEVFREVRRVLRDDGVLWLNLGDAYAGNHIAGGLIASARRDDHPIPRTSMAVPGLKPKDLMGQPWRVAFALQDDGWWLRQEVIWHKKNPMPESCSDRCTKAHEHVFLLAKSARYYFDAEAIKEPASENTNARRKGPSVPSVAGWATGAGPHTAAAHQTRENHRKVSPKAALASSGNDGAYSDGKSERMGRGAGWRNKQNESFDQAMAVMPERANKRSVWSIASEPFSGAHFATFPTELVKPCILAGSRPGDTVLDPFGGSGTTGLVADALGRSAILIDLDERNLPMARERIVGNSSLFAEVTTA